MIKRKFHKHDKKTFLHRNFLLFVYLPARGRKTEKNKEVAIQKKCCVSANPTDPKF
jgi:hypothetical protein